VHLTNGSASNNGISVYFKRTTTKLKPEYGGVIAPNTTAGGITISFSRLFNIGSGDINVNHGLYFSRDASVTVRDMEINFIKL
jgi:hypothetical protein